MSEYPVQSIRSHYSALNEVSYLNTGTIGIMSESVLERHLYRIARYEQYGHVGEAEARRGYEEARNAFARLINAASDEIALNRNATDGINFVLASLSLPAGSTLLTTSEEHPAVMFPITQAARRCSGSVRTLSLDMSDEELVFQLRSVLESTRSVSIVVLSHVSCETGRRLPVAEMVRVCRDHGVMTLIDGAQSVGQIVVDVAEIDCDFMTGNGHKWICGPKGTGFLYIRRDRVDDLTPPYVGAGATDPAFNRSQFPPYSNENWAFRNDAQRFEFGTRNWHLYGATVDAIDELDSIGRCAIEQHIAELSGSLKSGLADRRGITVHTPIKWSESSGLVTFTVDGWDGTALSERLWNEFGIIQRRVQIPNGVRLSCAHYTSYQDLTRFYLALDQIAYD